MQQILRAVAFIAATTLSCAAFADDRLQADFTFKRVGVPSGSAGSRITVQIDPTQRIAAPAEEPVTETPDAASQSRPLPMGWFWGTISPDLDQSGPGRLEQALAALRNAPTGEGVGAPRLTTLQGIAAAHGTDILRRTVGTDISPALVLALISVESGGKADAISRAGAQGLMQLMPATAERFGVQDAMSADENIKGGVAYLAWLMKHFDNDPILALAGYNAGEGSVRDNNGVPPYAETRAYVPKVLAAWTVARALCQTPPELVTDGCVFQVGG